MGLLVIITGGVLEGIGADDYIYLTNTMPVDDTYLLEDAFETQLVNLAGETQVMDLAGETQMVDLAGETQVLDDLDCMKSIPIEFLNEFTAEAGAASELEIKNKTEVMFETQELSQDNSVKIDDRDSVGLESTVDKDPAREGEYSNDVKVTFV